MPRRQILHRTVLHRLVRSVVVCIGLAAALGPAGCTTGGSVTLRSVGDSGVLSPKMRTIAYRTTEPGSADIYLTDLPESDLDPGIDLSTLTGNFLHIHLFLVPRAGHTPIESTASSVTIRYAVLSRGAIGVYGGGGFLLPRGRPGDRTLGGSIRAATMKPLAWNELFRDPLGAGELSARFRAPRDEPRARLMGARFEDIIRAVKEPP